MKTSTPSLLRALGASAMLVLLLPTACLSPEPQTKAEAIQQAREYRPPAGVGCTMALVPAIHTETGARYTFSNGCLAPGWKSDSAGFEPELSPVDAAPSPSVLQTIQQHSDAMLPTLERGEVVQVQPLDTSGVAGLDRGELVVFYHRGIPPCEDVDGMLPCQTADWGSASISRVIGLPGEKVGMTPQSVLVDDRPLSEPYLEDTAGGPRGTWKVPAGAYFLLGDNRAVASDSRVEGAVPFESVVGRLMLVQP